MKREIRITLRLPSDMAEKLSAQANANHRSMNSEIVARIEGRFDGSAETLRNKIAAQIAQGAVSGHFAHYGHETYWDSEALATYAYSVADAMIAACSGSAS